MGAVASFVFAVGNWFSIAASTVFVLGVGTAVLTIGGGAGIGVGVICGVQKKCDKRDLLSNSSITVVNGMPGWNQEDAPGVALYASSDINSDVLNGQKFVLPWDDVQTYVTHEFDHSAFPAQVHITNSGTTPICIAGISMIDPSGNWVTVSGDLGKVCQADTYESGTSELPGGTDPPKAESCVWIDRHGSNGIRLPGITFPLVTAGAAFGNSTPSAEDLCHPPYMLLPSKRSQPTTPLYGRDNASSMVNFETQVIKSNLTTSSAVKLCEGEFTKGPSFVSLPEQLYCDMTTRELHPVCSSEVISQSRSSLCFDVETDELVQLEGATTDVDDVSGSDSGQQMDNGTLSVKRRSGKVQAQEKSGRVGVIKTFEQVNVWE